MTLPLRFMEKTEATIRGEKILREKYTMDECIAMLEADKLGVERLVGIIEKGRRRRKEGFDTALKIEACPRS